MEVQSDYQWRGGNFTLVPTLTGAEAPARRKDYNYCKYNKLMIKASIWGPFS